jgi:hypothetical protein
VPSENVRDGLPSYQRAYSLRRMAAAVIRSRPRAERQRPATRTTREAEARETLAARRAETDRERRRAETTSPGASHTNAPTNPARPATETASQRRALPRSPHGTYDEAAVSAERLREQLRRER